VARGRNDYETAQIQGRLWTPNGLGAKAWHDASDISTITITGSGVSDWRDKSEDGITLSQSTDANRPSVVASGQSQNTAIYFADAGITKILSLSGSAPFSSGSEMSVFWAAKTPPSDSNNYAWCWTFANDPSRISVAGPFQGFVDYYADFNGTSGSNRISGVGPSHNTWAIFRARNSVSNSIKAVHANGASAFASTASGSSGTLTTYKLGAGPAGGGLNALTMGEILVFDQDLPAHTCARIEGYLSHKWGVRLAADHPFANRPPLIGD
jgi:hypothetical protein